MNTKLLLLFLLFPLNSTVHTWPFYWKHELTFFFPSYQSMYLSILLSNYLSTICYRYGFVNLNFISMFINHHSSWLFSWSNCSRFGPWKPIQGSTCVLVTCIHLSASFLSGMATVTSLILYFPEPARELLIFLNNLTNTIAYWHTYVKIKILGKIYCVFRYYFIDGFVKRMVSELLFKIR